MQQDTDLEPNSGRQPSSGAAAGWPLTARFIEREARLARWAGQRSSTLFVYEFVRFGVKQAWACLFGALLLAMLFLTWALYPKGVCLARYDFLLLAAVTIQALMLRFGLETWEEARVILVFHVVGTVMEVFLTAKGAWIYPEANVMRIGGVPLYTGFMYASVGSFMARSWRLFDFRFTHHPPMWLLAMLSVAIYASFFLRWIWDARPVLFFAAILVLAPGMIHYRIWRVHRRMPLLLAGALTAFFIWIAENIGTFTAIWLYPHQRAGWQPVGAGKYVSWFLLIIISYTLVAALHRPAALASREPASDSTPPGVEPALSRS